MRRISVFPLVCALLVLTVFACSSKPRSIQGKWRGVNGTETIEFLNDGTFQGVLVWDITRAPITLQGKYKVAGDNLDLVVTQPGSLTPMKWIVRYVSSDEIIVTYENGGALKRDGTSARYHKIT
jgi:hypothetical protein